MKRFYRFLLFFWYGSLSVHSEERGKIVLSANFHHMPEYIKPITGEHCLAAFLTSLFVGCITAFLFIFLFSMFIVNVFSWSVFGWVAAVWSLIVLLLLCWERISNAWRYSSTGYLPC